MPVAPHCRLRAALKQCAPYFAAAALFSGAVNILYLSSPLYLMQVYDRVLISESLPTLAALTMVLLLALGTMALLDALRTRVLIRCGIRFDQLISRDVFAAMIGHGSRGGGTGTAQPLRDLDDFRTFVTGPGIHFIFDAPWMPIYLVILWLIDAWLGCLATSGAAVLLCLATLNEMALRSGLRLSEQAAVRSYAWAGSVARHGDVIEAMGMHEAVRDHWQSGRTWMLWHQAAASDSNGDCSAAIRFARLLLQALMLGLGAWLAIDQVIKPATIFAASILLGRALVPVEQAVAVWKQFHAVRSAYRNVSDLLRQQPAEPVASIIPRDRGGIEVEGLTYGLPARSAPILSGATFSLGAGEALAIVGPSGAGKSTLARLLVGAIPPAAGKLRFGGIDYDHWNRAEFGRQVGYLPQDVGLLPGTVRDNIARFSDCNMAEVVEAARRAGVHETILELPKAYDTPLGDGGSGLSGGQRQRLGLARALLGNPSLLVLDEPNANLDRTGEQALHCALLELKRDGTTIVLVTHRQSALSLVDRLMVVEGGAISALGPVDEVFAALRQRAGQERGEVGESAAV